MSRVNTGVEHRVINEGMTGRIIARRALRRTLGNPKKRAKDLAEFAFEMFGKGAKSGKKIENLRILYATAGMEYGAEYTVEATNGDTVETGEAQRVDSSDSGVPDAASPSELLGSPDARGAEGVDAYGGTDFPQV